VRARAQGTEATPLQLALTQEWLEVPDGTIRVLLAAKADLDGAVRRNPLLLHGAAGRDVSILRRVMRVAEAAGRLDLNLSHPDPVCAPQLSASAVSLHSHASFRAIVRPMRTAERRDTAPRCSKALSPRVRQRVDRRARLGQHRRPGSHGSAASTAELLAAVTGGELIANPCRYAVSPESCGVLGVD
jgi:hypothetical protein